LSGVGIEGLAKKVLDFLIKNVYTNHSFNRETKQRNNMYKPWTDKEYNRLIKYLRNNSIFTDTEAIVADYGGIMIDRDDDDITDKAIVILQRQQDYIRFEKLFKHDKKAVYAATLKYALEGKTLDEIYQKAKKAYPQVLRRDIARILAEAYREHWYQLAVELQIEDPILPKGFEFYKKLIKQDLTTIRKVLGGTNVLD
jgi:hypothetical protein